MSLRNVVVRGPEKTRRLKLLYPNRSAVVLRREFVSWKYQSGRDVAGEPFFDRSPL